VFSTVVSDRGDSRAARSRRCEDQGCVVTSPLAGSVAALAWQGANAGGEKRVKRWAWNPLREQGP
jgi:hypothetical protein